MSTRPELSVIIPWSNRPELETTLRRNSRQFTACPAEVVVVNCGGDPELFRRVLGARPFPGLRGVELPGVGFNKSLALNVGVGTARAERLFFLDTDIVLGADLLGPALTQLGRRHVVTVDRTFESQRKPGRERSNLVEMAYSVRFVDAKGRSAQVETNLMRPRENSRSAPGLVFLRRKHFLAVDGMNSDLSGWGWEDLDLLVRLQLELGLSPRRSGSVTHLTHGDEHRDLQGQSRAASEHLNFARCLECYRVGHYRGTYTDDTQTWNGRLVELEPSRLKSGGGRRRAAP
ncbi:galactosyltransferase-related protein [Archangium lipolyticum]|uniref:galactosyltransferase-related protein n=1 Tax=Archangium lipolyticum TaxID=2970465 RepID=UPI002149D192|nr:galactosyltransferase-related protein [Archangium lipolyticum]